MQEVKRQSIRVEPYHINLLDELIKEREKTGNPIKSKQGIVSELIIKAHKKEVK